MLMQGDINKVLVQVNEVLATAFKRIEALEDKVQLLETPGPIEIGEFEAPKRRGRPPGAKNKEKIAA